MGARIAMARLAKMNLEFAFAIGTGLHHRINPASGGCQQPVRDMLAAADIVKVEHQSG